MHSYVGTLQWAGRCPLKSAPSRWGSGSISIYGSLGSRESAPPKKMASPSVLQFLHSTPVCPTHRHTDHTTCDICSNRPNLCSACRRCAQKTRMLAINVSILNPIVVRLYTISNRGNSTQKDQHVIN